MKYTTMPTEKPSKNDGRYTATKQARQTALKRLVAKYQDEYNAMLDEERAALGLHPLHAPVPEPVEPSAAEWVPEAEMSLDDRVEWAYPGERYLAGETNEALVEVVVRQIKEPAAPWTTQESPSSIARMSDPDLAFFRKPRPRRGRAGPARLVDRGAARRVRPRRGSHPTGPRHHPGRPGRGRAGDRNREPDAARLRLPVRHA